MSLWFSAALITGAALAASTISHSPTARSLPERNTSIKVTKSPVQGSGSSSNSGSKNPITIEGLARAEGILSYCSTIDKKNAAKYQQALGNILSGHSSSEIKDDQGNSKYTLTLVAVDAEIAKVPVSTVLSSCKNFIAGGR